MVTSGESRGGTGKSSVFLETYKRNVILPHSPKVLRLQSRETDNRSVYTEEVATPRSDGHFSRFFIHQRNPTWYPSLHVQ